MCNKCHTWMAWVYATGKQDEGTRPDIIHSKIVRPLLRTQQGGKLLQTGCGNDHERKLNHYLYEDAESVPQASDTYANTLND